MQHARNRSRPQQQNTNRTRRTELEFHRKLIGEQVCISRMRDGSELTAKLLWVDRYTLGLRDERGEFAMNKGAIEVLRRDMGKRDERRGGEASR